MIGFIVTSDEPQDMKITPDEIRRINEKYEIWFYEENKIPNLSIREFSYSAIPKCLGLLEDEAMVESGIIKLQNYPTLSLKGQGVFIAIIDTGINYSDEIFNDKYGNSRIFAIYDMENETEYDNEKINEGNIPNMDSNGHGTYIASIAAGGERPKDNFVGAAPEAELLVVRLPSVSDKLKDFYFIPKESTVYSESDIMLGVNWADKIAEKNNKPLVILLGLGCNNGGHSGTSYLADYLDDMNSKVDRAVVVATGNEAINNHHYSGIVKDELNPDRIEINVESGVNGFYFELWAKAPERFALQIQSPTGSYIPKTRPYYGDNEIGKFTFEETIVEIDYRNVGKKSRDELIFVRLSNVIAGIWNIIIYPEKAVSGNFNIYLPMENLLEGSVFFIKPNPFSTLTMPSDGNVLISAGGYQTNGGGVYLKSGRGYPLNNIVKPDFVAPAVNVRGRGLLDNYIILSGTSAASAITAGACAQILQWGSVEKNAVGINGVDIKNLFIRGSMRQLGEEYPNRELGYGKLNVYDALRII